LNVTGQTGLTQQVGRIRANTELKERNTSICFKGHLPDRILANVTGGDDNDNKK
jgi:hypothetical protein